MRCLLRLTLLCLLWQAVWHCKAGESKRGAPVVSTNLHNLFVIDNRLYSGSSPEDEKSFQELKERGIRTIISVDGTPPPVELARKAGIRYIHIPIGYDRIKDSDALKILRAAETVSGPIYIHCHHGKHRGPAAVAVICKGTGLWNEKEALGWLGQAGTSTDYPGLFETAKFQRPSAVILQQVPAVFPEKVETSGLVRGMVDLDKQWDKIKVVLEKEADLLKVAPGTIEAAMLALEAMKEMQRLPESKKLGEDFMTRLAASQRFFETAHDAFKPGATTVDQARSLKQEISAACSSCHRKYRN